MELASLAHRVRELTEGTPEREALLARLAAAIRDGAYEVDADALARDLLQEFEGPSYRDRDPK